MSAQLIYVTKYALSKGILTYPKDHDGSTTDYVVVKDKHGFNGVSLYDGNDWHTTMEAAIKQAEKMRVKKIASLKKQIKEFEALKF